MPNYNRLFSLDSETINILKECKNQSETVREAVKRYNILKDIEMPVPEPIVEDVD